MDSTKQDSLWEGLTGFIRMKTGAQWRTLTLKHLHEAVLACWQHGAEGAALDSILLLLSPGVQKQLQMLGHPHEPQR